MIGKVFYNRLITDAAITGICGLNIFPDIAPQNGTYPFVVYTMISSTPVDFKDGQSNLEEIDVQLDIYGNNYDTIMDLNNKIRNRLDRFSGIVEGVSVQTITYKGSDSNVYNADINVYWTSSDYNAKMKR